MDVLSNSFCAGGTVLGNGTWLNAGERSLLFASTMIFRLITFSSGGNQAITYGGAAMPTNQQSGQSPYADWDGGKAVRLLDPCDDESCNWVDDPALYMTSRRWYPTLETLEDGSAIIMGGCGELSCLVLSYFSILTATRMGRIRQLCRQSKQPYRRIFSSQGRAVHPQLPSQHHACEPLPSSLAPSLWQSLCSSRVSS